MFNRVGLEPGRRLRKFKSNNPNERSLQIIFCPLDRIKYYMAQQTR